MTISPGLPHHHSNTIPSLLFKEERKALQKVIDIAFILNDNDLVSVIHFNFQCEGKEYNHKSDIWALGCILYEMASRQKTFEGSNLPALVNKIMKVRCAV